MSLNSQLPIELVAKIIQCAYYRTDKPTRATEPDRTTLSSCSLVSSSWTPIAQQLLFHSATGRKFHNVVSPQTHRARLLGSFVRTLDIAIGGHDDDVYDPSELASLLLCCPKLYELTLRIQGLHHLTNTCIAELRSITPTVNLQALRLLESGVQSPVLYQLTSLWPNIRFLTIGSEMVASPPPTAAKLHLYELSLFRVLPTEILEWLLSSSTTTLSIFELKDPTSAEIEHLLALHGAQLRSLRFMRFNAHSSRLVQSLTHLEELILLYVPPFVRVVLPPSLKHLSFNHPQRGNGGIKSITAALQDHPNMRSITCDEYAERHVDFAKLKEVCEGKGIEISVDNTRTIWTRDDPIVADWFPRRRSVSNFHLMNVAPRPQSSQSLDHEERQ